MELGNSNFIKACYKQNDGPIPIWIMRQAGRYLPEYQEVRSKASFKELCQSPELITKVVKQPIDRFNLDAAILFSDILTFLDPMGAPVSFPDGGPIIESPIKTPDDLKTLKKFDFHKELPFVFEGIKKIKEALPDIPLLGFAGSPFTIACYLIEGKGSKHFEKAKQFLHKFPDAAEKLIDFLADTTADYLSAQIDAGADAVQLFDSWGGILSRDDYQKFSATPADRIFKKLKNKKVPCIFFVNNIAPYVDLVNNVDCDVVGVDYRMNLKSAMDALSEKAVQGNLDPNVLFGTTEHVKEKTLKLLDSVTDYNRLIFNLGHGIQPKTPIESVSVMVETVKNYR